MAAIFLYLASALVLLSCGAIGLLALELFRPLYFILFSTAAIVPLTVAFFRQRPSVHLSRSEWVVIGIFILALALRSNPATFLYGGQDPGVYANVSSFFANHGRSTVIDPMPQLLADREDLKSYYFSSSYRYAFQTAEGKWVGAMFPGLYLKDMARSEFVPQFYHLHPLWLAVGQWLFGLEHRGWILAIFSSLSVICTYLITKRVTGSEPASLSAAFLLATNPAHSYFSTFPVSETVAGFFFLSGLYFLISRVPLPAILSFACLFFTRITGFITLPFVLISLFFQIMKLRNPREIVTGLAAIFVYALSFYWGLKFSPNYSADIYRGKLAIMPDFLAQAIWIFALLAALWVVAAWCAIRFKKLSRALVNTLVSNHKLLAIVIVAAIVLGIGYRGYLLAYTDAFVGHRWFWRRWDMAGHGVESIKKLSFFVLGLMLSPIGLVAFLAGLIQIWIISLKRSRLLPLAVFASGFLAVLAIKQLTVPYLYYYGRYLVSELVPLAIILGSVAVATIKARSTKVSSALWCSYTFGCFLLLSPSLLARLSFTEGKEFTQAMRCINELTPGKSVILVDKRHFAEAPIVTPLRLTFDKLTFAFYRNKFREDEQLRGLFEYFAQKGYSVFLISSQTVWNDVPFLKRVTRIPALMRTLSGKAGLPSKARVRSYPVRIYSYGEVGAIPEICQSLSELRQ